MKEHWQKLKSDLLDILLLASQNLSGFWLVLPFLIAINVIFLIGSLLVTHYEAPFAVQLILAVVGYKCWKEYDQKKRFYKGTGFADTLRRADYARRYAQHRQRHPEHRTYPERKIEIVRETRNYEKVFAQIKSIRNEPRALKIVTKAIEKRNYDEKWLIIIRDNAQNEPRSAALANAALR